MWTLGHTFKQLGYDWVYYDRTFDIAQEWWSGKKLAHAPTIEAFRWMVLDTHLITVSQVRTHAQLDLGEVIEEAKQVNQIFALTSIAWLILQYV